MRKKKLIPQISRYIFFGTLFAVIFFHSIKMIYAGSFPGGENLKNAGYSFSTNYVISYLNSCRGMIGVKMHSLVRLCPTHNNQLCQDVVDGVIIFMGLNP
jgi:hypothetical protein